MIEPGFITKSGGIVIAYENNDDKLWENKRRVYVECQICNNIDLMIIKTVKHKKAYCTKCFTSSGVKRDKLINKRIGLWTVEKFLNKLNKYNYNLYQCRCDCGTIRELPTNSLDGRSQSCGCRRRELTKLRYANFPKKIRKTRKINSVVWRELVKKIKDRDKVCVLCDGDSKLTIHHLNGWNWAESERYSENNLILLCGLCHDDFHSKYLKGNNTKEQFLEYAQNYDFKVT